MKIRDYKNEVIFWACTTVTGERKRERRSHTRQMSFMLLTSLLSSIQVKG